MTEDQTNAAWGWGTTLVALVFVGGGLTWWLANGSVEKEERAKAERGKQTQQPDNTLAALARKMDFVEGFYSLRCFSVKRLACPSFGNATIEVEFTNRTAYPIEAVRFGLTA